MIRLLLLPLVFVFAANPALSAGFDCNKASHRLEKMICGDPGFSSQDDRMSAAYREKMALVFDKAALRSAQSLWQKNLRRECMISDCLIGDMQKAYGDRISALGDTGTESYYANYKTSDGAELKIHHVDLQDFDFSIIRQYVDAPEQATPLCKFPADGEAGAVARITSANAAGWSDGACTIDFAFSRDKKGSVVEIHTAPSDACRRYCPGGGFTLGDRFTPNNDWPPYE